MKYWAERKEKRKDGKGEEEVRAKYFVQGGESKAGQKLP